MLCTSFFFFLNKHELNRTHFLLEQSTGQRWMYNYSRLFIMEDFLMRKTSDTMKDYSRLKTKITRKMYYYCNSLRVDDISSRQRTRCVRQQKETLLNLCQTFTMTCYSRKTNRTIRICPGYHLYSRVWREEKRIDSVDLELSFSLLFAQLISHFNWMYMIAISTCRNSSKDYNCSLLSANT